MKNVQSLVPTFIAALLLIVSTAAAHNPPKNRNALVYLKQSETLHIAFRADCNVPQDTDDYSIVPLDERSISFDLKIEGGIPGSISFSESLASFDLPDGTSQTIDVPASTFGTLLGISLINVSGQGVCRLRAADYIEESNTGYTVRSKVSEAFYIEPRRIPQ